MSSRKKTAQQKRQAPAPTSGGQAPKSAHERAQDWTAPPMPDRTNFVLNNDLYPEITPKFFKQSGGSKYYEFGSTGAETAIFGKSGDSFFCTKTSLLELIQQCINYSPTNARIIEAKANYAFGGEILLDKKSPNYARNTAILNRLGVREVLEKVGYDYFAYNNFFVEIIREGGEMKIDRLVLDFVRLRGNNSYIPTEIGVSYEWVKGSLSGTSSNAAITNIPIFDKRTHQYGQKNYHHAFFVKGETPGRIYWALPKWWAARPSCETDYFAPNTNALYFKNGCKLEGVLLIKGIGADSTAAQDELNKMMKDPQNTGKTLVKYTRAEGEGMQGNIAQYFPLHSFTEGSYLKLTESSRDNILIAHGFTASLAGISVAGKLGSNENIETEFEIIQKGIIAPAQKKIQNEFLIPLFKEIDATYNTTLEADFVGLEVIAPASMRGKLDPKEALTRDEQREALGFAPLTEQQKSVELADTQQKITKMGAISNFFNKLKFW